MSGSPVEGIVESLEAVGVRFRLDGEKIKARLPESSSHEILKSLETLRTRRTELATLLRERENRTLAPCGSPECAGCYSVIHPESGKAVRIHPPKASREWLERWEPNGPVQ